MSDPFDTGAETEPSVGDGPEMVDAVAARTCKEPGCPNPLPTSGQGWHFRQYCDEHFKGSNKKKKANTRGRGGGKTGDRTPGTVKVQIGTARAPKGDPGLDKVEANVRQLCQTITGLLVLIGQAEDANDIRQGTEQLAQALKNLAQYEPWLKKLLAGGGSSDRVMAWVTAVMALLAILYPILDRRQIIPPQLKEVLGLAGAVSVTTDPAAAEAAMNLAQAMAGDGDVSTAA